MNISNQIQIIYVPLWVKVIVFFLVSLLISICGFLLYDAMFGAAKSDWISAGAHLLGIVFPILIVVILVGGASFGERSILERTERMLTKTIPYHLQFIPEEPRKFVDFKKFRRAAWTDKKHLADISLFYSKGRCYADYKILVPTSGKALKLDLRVELNIKRANVNVSFELNHLHCLMKRDRYSGNELDYLRSKFSHTLEVERKQANERDAAAQSGGGTIAYDFSENLLPRKIDDKEYLVVVATTALADDTVWNPSEAVFFAQDLLFMTRAFLQECPDVFSTEKV